VTTTALKSGVMLGRHKLYMLPTRLGMILSVVLFAMLLASVNYNNSLAFLFTFLLSAMAFVSMLYTHRNLAGLELQAGPCEPVFAGELAHFTVVLTNNSALPKVALRLHHRGKEVVRCDVQAGTSQSAMVPVPASQRGRLKIPEMVFSSDFPLGIFFSWSKKLKLDQHCLVYPRPIGELPFSFVLNRQRYQDRGTRTEGDDFLGLRAYRPGDPPRHIHWKAVARGQVLLTKEFGGAGQDTVNLDWDLLGDMDKEARLSQLCRWVVDAHNADLHYSLHLPGINLPVDHGDTHQRRCLNRLALY